MIIQKQTENKYRDPIDVKVEEWSKGRETNVRGLLASLHEVLWEGHNWKPISVGDLLQVKFRKIFTRNSDRKIGYLEVIRVANLLMETTKI